MFSFFGLGSSQSGHLSDHGKDALKRYRYRGTDKSLLYKYALSPWADYCVQRFTPEWLAPNAITLFGLCFQALSFAVAFYYSPDMGNAPPWWTYLLTAACMFIYSTADNMDGKQARRTGSSSPLGLLFDHGCDAVNAGLLGWASSAIHLQAGGSWRAFAVWAIPTVPFFYNTWEEYHTGELVLPIINGPNEGVMGMAFFLCITAFFGPEGMWSATHTTIPMARWALTPLVDGMRWMAGEGTALAGAASTSLAAYFAAWTASMPFTTSEPPLTPGVAYGSPITNLEMLLAFTAGAAAVTVLYQTYNVCKVSWAKSGAQGVGEAMARQVPFLSLCFIMSSWLHNMHCRKVVYDHWALFYGCAGALFTDLTVRLMVAHVTDSEYHADVTGLVAFALAPLVLRLDMLPAGPDKSAFAALCLLISLVFSWLPMMGYVLGVTREVARTLDIDVFDIRRQRERMALHAKPTSTLEAGAMALASVKGGAGGLGVPAEEGSAAQQVAGTTTTTGRAGSTSRRGTTAKLEAVAVSAASEGDAAGPQYGGRGRAGKASASPGPATTSRKRAGSAGARRR